MIKQTTKGQTLWGKTAGLMTGLPNMGSAGQIWPSTKLFLAGQIVLKGIRYFDLDFILFLIQNDNICDLFSLDSKARMSPRHINEHFESIKPQMLFFTCYSVNYVYVHWDYFWPLANCLC